MKFKRTILITLLLAIFTIGAVSAAEDNATDNVINIENDNTAADAINLDEKSSEIATNNYKLLGLNEKSNETTLTTNNEDDTPDPDDFDEFEDEDSRKLTVKSIKVYSNEKFTYTVKLTDNNKPVSGETIELTIFDSKDNSIYYTVKTNSNGIATFKIGPQSKGKYIAYIETYDLFEEKYITVIQNPKTKTTVKAPGVTAKYKQNKYFKVTVKNYKGKPIKKLNLKLKVYTNHKYKYYKIKTNSKGIALFNTKKLKAGSHVVYIYNADKKYDITKKSKIIIKKAKNPNIKTVTMKINSPKSYFASKKLTTGDKLHTVYSLGGQYPPGVSAEVSDFNHPIHTKILKIKFYFKNKDSGKIKTKVQTKISNLNKYDEGYSGGGVNLITNYIPYKATVWYKKI